MSFTDAQVYAALHSYQEPMPQWSQDYPEEIEARFQRMRAALEAADAAAWQSIETAPKSTVDEHGRVQGVYLLGFCPDEAVDPASCLSVIWWEPLTNGGVWYGQEAIEVRPTRWRHIGPPQEPGR